LPLVALIRFHDRVETGLRVVRREKLRIAGTGRNRRRVANEQHVGSVRAPDQCVTVDAPVVGHFADRNRGFWPVERRDRTVIARRRLWPRREWRGSNLAGRRLVNVVSSGFVAVRGWRRRAAGASPSYRRSLNNSENLAAGADKASFRHAACELRGKSYGMSRFGQEASLSTALVPSYRPSSGRGFAIDRRPHADFIAHLIAMSSQAPQTRVHRRAAPTNNRELSCARRWRPVPGRVLSRSL